MAAEKATPKAAGKVIKARLLCTCHLGAADDVVEVDVAAVESLEGLIDTAPAAVAYANSLKG